MPSITNIVDSGLKNYLINGRLDYWQRGTTSSVNITTNSTNSSGYLADRFGYKAFKSTNNQAYTWTREVDVPQDAVLNSELSYSIRCTANANHSYDNSDICVPFYQLVEGNFMRDIQLNDELCINFWLKSNATGYMPTAISIGSYYRVAYIQYDTPNTWKKYRVVFRLDNNALSFAKDNTAGMGIYFLTSANTSGNWGAANTATWNSSAKYTVIGCSNWGATAGNWVQMAGISVTKSKTVLNTVPLAARSVFDELSLCQRYYEKIYIPSSTYMALYVLEISTNRFRGQFISYKTPKRTAFPAGSFTAGIGSNAKWVSGSTIVSAADTTGLTVDTDSDGWKLRQTRVAGGTTPTVGYTYQYSSDFTVTLDSEFSTI